MRKAIVLGADAAYMDKVETTIKSVCAHNEGITFYVFNDDLPSQWFRLMNHRLKAIDCQVVNIKISDNHLRNYHLPLSHLSYATYFRYFIPDFVVEDQVLYLDSDIIVRANLDPLFTYDLKEAPLAAVKDALPGPYFNAGVMLINNRYWKDHQVSQALIDLTNQYHRESFGDQGILNRLFEGQWLELDLAYNFTVGMDTVATTMKVFDWYPLADRMEEKAHIIHYTDDKPWAQTYRNRLGDLWWFYYGMEWSDILLRRHLKLENLDDMVETYSYRTAIFTNSSDMEHLTYLIEGLPQVHFALLAPTLFAGSVMDLQRYPNVTVYPMFNTYNLRHELSQMDFYLDINHHQEVGNITQEVLEQEKPIFAFETTSHDQSGHSLLFDPEQPEKMLEAIEAYLENLDK